MFLEEIIDIEEIGTSYYLGDIGANEYAFPKEGSLKVISLLRNKMIPILGGDVYARDGGSIVPAYVNWFYDWQESEPYSDYVIRSCEKAYDFVSNYPSCDNALFVIVPGDLLQCR